MDEKKLQDVVVNTATIVGSTYSQVQRVTVTNIDITIEFAFINPSEPAIGQVVARVTMPLIAGIDLAQTILKTQNIHVKIQKGEKDD